MKICVYAICKNEEKFVSSWLESMQEADYICVLDTGSRDKTVELLRAHPKVILQQKVILPWRFDVARNESMKLIPADADICCCIDLDETFNKGWRKVLERGVTSKTKQVRYRYTWNFNPDGSEGIVFFADKIHARDGFYWRHPVHEVITPVSDEPYETVTLPALQLNHHADDTKSRGQYLPLLELAVREDPENDRNTHYLGREYYFHAEYDKAIATLTRHLTLEKSTWADERSASLRLIAKCYLAKGDLDNAEKYYKLAVCEQPFTRESLYELGEFYYEQNRIIDATATLTAMLNIRHRELNYISNPNCWNAMPYDILSVCYYQLNDLKNAEKYCRLALSLDPDNERIKNNLKIITKKTD